MIRRSLREVVLRTNRFGPFQYGYGAIYRLAVECFLHYVARSRPMVRSVYLRRSQNGQKWVPGLSDIDLTIVLDAPSSSEEQYRLLEDFWQAHSRLKSMFPMFGEVEVLAQNEFGTWLANTSYGPGRRPWELIYGEADAALEVNAISGWQLRALRLAWWIYEDLLPPCVAQPDSLVRDRDIQRRIAKISRLLAPVLREAGQPELSASHHNSTDMVASALKALESAACYLLPVRRTQPREGPSSSLFRSRVEKGQMLVVEDGLDREALSQLLVKNYQLKQNASLLLPRCLLEYRVRFYDPYDYSVLSSDWAVAGGHHPLEHVPSPGKPEFLQYLLDHLRNLQVMSRGEELFTNDLSVDEVSNTLLMVVALRILQDGRLIPSRNDVCKQSTAEFPEYGRAAEKISSLITARRQPEARQEYFSLLRSIMSEVGPLLEVPDPVASTASAS
jgi:hypothetical protein